MGRPTMDDVAARAGVSRALVSLVMRDSPRVSTRSRQKVLEAAAELGYQPNLSARHLASGQSDTVGVMLNDLNNPFFTEMAQGAAATAAEHGRRVLINSGWGLVSGETEAIESLVALRTDGLVLGAPRLPNEVLSEFARRTPTVCISIYGRPDAFDTVGNDETIGARLVVDHLAELGHERIAHIHAMDAPGGPQRRSGFIEAMVGHGLAPILVDGDFTEEAGASAAAQLLSLREPPTAIMACNDLAAVGVLGFLSTHGLRVPDDISVIGYDDTLLASLSTTALTTVHQPRQLLGRRAVELLLERLGGRAEACHELVEPRLVVRRSTGPMPGA